MKMGILLYFLNLEIKKKTKSIIHKRYGKKSMPLFLMKGVKIMHFTGTKYLHEIESLMQGVPKKENHT